MAHIRITLTLDNLGQIPEHQNDGSQKEKKTQQYFDDGLCDEPLEKQVALFGAAHALKMVSSEISSWLSDLGTEPQIHDIIIAD